MSFVPSDASFRFPLAFQCVYLLIALVFIAGLPESPRILYLWKRDQEADHVLARLHGVAGRLESSQEAMQERLEILQAIKFEEEQMSGEVTWRDIFWDKSHVRNSRRVFIAIIMQALQQLGKATINRFSRDTDR